MEKFRCSRMTLVPVICLLTILTYVDLFPASIRYNLSYVVWIIAFAECIVSCKLRISFDVGRYVGGGILFFLLVFLLQLFSHKSYFGATCYSVALCLGLFLIGALLGQKYTQEDVRVICRWYVIAAVIIALIVFRKGIGIGFNLSSRQSFGVNKNSVGQILSTAVCILLIGLDKSKSRINSILRIVFSLFLVLMVFLIRSRTSILCFGIVILVIIAGKSTSNKVRWGIILGLIAVALVVAINPSLRNTLVYNILLANRDATNLDSITSGRIVIYSSFDELMRGHGLFGNGARYYESFYLSNFVQFGWIIGLYLDLFTIWMIYLIRKRTIELDYHQLLYIVALSYSLNGVFEGLPPFGPGTKNLLLWLLFGIAMTHVSRVKSGDESILHVGSASNEQQGLSYRQD